MNLAHYPYKDTYQEKADFLLVNRTSNLSCNASNAVTFLIWKLEAVKARNPPMTGGKQPSSGLINTKQKWPYWIVNSNVTLSSVKKNPQPIKTFGSSFFKRQIFSLKFGGEKMRSPSSISVDFSTRFTLLLNMI